MPQPAHLDPSAFAAGSGPVGALLIHGLTGSVAETRPMAEYLAAQGLAVSCPLLPGHGTTSQALIRVRWQDWAAEAEAALVDLQARCTTVFVGGLSMGALLALWLGAEHPDVAGLIPMAPAIKLQNRLAPLTLGLRRVLRFSPLGAIGDDDLGDPAALDRIWCYDDLVLWAAGEFYLLQRSVNRALSQIRQPILIFQGKRDAQVHPQAPQMLYDRVAATDKTLVWLENSGHNLLADGEREFVWARSHAWMLERCPE